MRCAEHASPGESLEQIDAEADVGAHISGLLGLLRSMAPCQGFPRIVA
jgi:hypothetical protein